MNQSYERNRNISRKENIVLSKIFAFIMIFSGIIGSFIMSIFLAKAIFYCINIQKGFNIIALLLGIVLILFFIIFYWGLIKMRDCKEN